MTTSDFVADSVSIILKTVKNSGDNALLRYNAKFDKILMSAPELRVKGADIARSAGEVTADLKKAIVSSASNIKRFHETELKNIKLGWSVSNNGTVTGQLTRPVKKVGIYVPGGRFSYPSTVLMTAIPARVAGVEEVIMVTPPGKITAGLLFAAKTAGVDKIYRVGGPWSIAALAFGTETVPRVDMIVGPGNKFINEAKRQVFGIVGIDSLAGPSEIAIVADDSADERFIAQDILAQLEHDPDAKAYLYTDSLRLLRGVNKVLYGKAGRKQFVAVKCSIERAVDLVNKLAPEHLELVLKNAKKIVSGIYNAGAVFAGNYSPVAAGDYWAGPSHTLPTGASARFSSGISVATFLKRTSYIELSKSAFMNASKHIKSIAGLEGLVEHKKSIEVRER